MIVILEGPRGTGKTSLAKALVQPFNELGYTPTIAKFERGEDPHEDMRKSLVEFGAECLSNKNKAVIIDRFHLTEFVMRMADGTVPRGKLMHDMIRISYLAEKISAWVVVLNTSEAERQARVAKRADGRGDESSEVLHVWDFVTTILGAYDGERTFNNTFLVNTGSAKAEQLAKQLLLRIKFREEANARK